MTTRQEGVPVGTLQTREGGDREFLYLHFMNWRSQRYRSFGRAPWPELGTDPVRIGWREAERNGFAISPLGFTSPATEEDPSPTRDRLNG